MSESTTPLGTMTDQGKTPIVTNRDVCRNPGAYEGTANDPLNWPTGGMPLISALFADGGYVPATFGEWLKAAPEQALGYCIATRGFVFNMAALSAGQKAKLGL